MNLYMDSEFTNLHQNTTLISLGLVSDDERVFYAEFTDYDKSQMNEWLNNNVIQKLTLEDDHYSNENGNVTMRHNTNFIVAELEEWLEQFEEVTIWVDHYAYDWVLFCELFGGAMNIPKNIYYIPMDLSTLLFAKGVDPDISRVEFANFLANQHNALEDARVIKECYRKLMMMDTHVTMK